MKYKIVAGEYQSIEYADIVIAQAVYKATCQYHCFLGLSDLVRFVCGETVWEEFDNG